MRRVITIVSILIAGSGLLIGLFPAVSVWRLSGHALEQLPDVAAATSTDDRHRFALTDDDFVLATRRYQQTPASDVESALVNAGFTPTSLRGERWLSMTCCGEYDAVLVRVHDAGDGSSVATLTAVDTDLQLSWPFFAGLGIAMMLGGIAVFAIGLQSLTRPEPPDSATSGLPREPDDLPASQRERSVDEAAAH